MTSTAKPIPDGFRAVTPHLVVKGCAEALAFYARAFGAEERFRMPMPDGRIGHAEIAINGAIVMLADEFPECEGTKAPATVGGTTVAIHLYVDDVDAAWERAIAAGATVVMPLEDMFWGDRYGAVRDPFGHQWSLAQHVRDVTPQEMEAAMAAMCGGAPA